MKMPQHASLSDGQITQIVQLMVRASVLILKHYAQSALQPVDVILKADASPVTVVDMQVHTLICEQLAIITPDIPVLSEEGNDHAERHQWSSCWLLDPLDGTKEFIHRSDEFTINLAYIQAAQVSFSCIMAPMFDVGYLAYAGTLFQFTSKTVPQVFTPPPAQFNQAHSLLRAAISRRASERSLSAYQTFFDYLTAQSIRYQTVEAGSAYKFCLMLTGAVDVYVRLHPTSEWDTAAGQGLLEAMGGLLIDRQGRPFSYNQRAQLDNGPFIALRHPDLFEVIAPWWLPVAD